MPGYREPVSKTCAGCQNEFSTIWARQSYCDACRAKCRIEGCSSPMSARGLCGAHLNRFYDRGDPAAPRLREWQSGECSVDGCERAAEKRGFCGLHYKRVQDNGVPGPPVVMTKPRGVACEVSGCVRLADADGLCNMHYSRRLREGDVGDAGPRRAANGEGHINHRGYHLVTKNGRTRGKHRVVMEERLGRPLLDHERVHHLNGLKGDNADRNLELWSVAHPTGQRVEDHVEFALSVLQNYPDLLADRGYRLLPLAINDNTAILGKPSFADFDAAEVMRRYKSPTG